MLLSILIALAVFSASISVGIWFGRRQVLSGQVAYPSAAAPSSAPAAAAPPTTGSSGGGLLQPGDRIELRLTDLSGSGTPTTQPLTVNPQGMVTLPLIGTIRAQYLTPEQLELAIAQTYKDRNLLANGRIRIVRLPGTTTAPAPR
jgi:protein involved in polysaccharide export with SLBB domain